MTVVDQSLKEFTYLANGQFSIQWLQIDKYNIDKTLITVNVGTKKLQNSGILQWSLLFFIEFSQLY